MLQDLSAILVVLFECIAPRRIVTEAKLRSWQGTVDCGVEWYYQGSTTVLFILYSTGVLVPLVATTST
jgi:hypothetical protein